MMNWKAPEKPIEYAESTLITAIINGDFPIGSALPGERDLAVQLGITRPTLREVLQRLERDGWLTIQQGKPTQVNHFWQDGGLNILAGIAKYTQTLPVEFVPNLLQVRLDLAPTYTRLAIEQNADLVSAFLAQAASLSNTPADYAAFDWQLQRHLTLHCGNPVYTLILNGFQGFYEQLAYGYFTPPISRQVSHVFYMELLEASQRGDALHAESITREVMKKSIQLWLLATQKPQED